MLYVDLSNLGQDMGAVEEELAAVSPVIQAQPERSVVGLVDLRNTPLSKESTALMKEHASRLGSRIKRAAVVLNRVTGFTRVIIGAIAQIGRREILPFEDLDQAQAWLMEAGEVEVEGERERE